MIVILISLFSDPICPWCFIGKRRLETALSLRPDINVRISWHAYQLNPLMPRIGMERTEYLNLKFGNLNNAEYLHKKLKAVGKNVGINFKFDRITYTPNTLIAHRLINYASLYNAQNIIVERLFNAYFTEGKNIGDQEILSELAIDSGLEQGDIYTYLNSENGTITIKSEDSYARQLGITGVPYFLLDKQFGISGAQEPEAFFPLFDLLKTIKATNPN